MRDHQALIAVLEKIDGRSYGAYKDLKGPWSLPRFTLHVDHVQGDPFAAPSRVRVTLPPHEVRLPHWAVDQPDRVRGVAHALARRFTDAARSTQRFPDSEEKDRVRRGSGKSGEIRMAGPGQEILAQTAVLIGSDGGVEARFTVGLPADGRRILGPQAARLLSETLPALVGETLVEESLDLEDLQRHAHICEDSSALRGLLPGLRLVGFVADGALLPRRTGVDDRPLEAGAVPFVSPTSLRVTVTLPNAGEVAGMGIPEGVTVIVGGGFHGKSTLLRAVERGVYDHAPDDGRERVVTVPDAVKVRAEDGRSVAGVDISPFISSLPGGRETAEFSSPNASGSTSQAAATVEALEAGATVLLVDEDTAATNFMIRDRRMQTLVPPDAEPITPFVDRIRELAQRGLSTLLVLGGSGDYLDVADTVIGMRDYAPTNLTERAAEVAAELPTGRVGEARGAMAPPAPRIPDLASLSPRKGRREINVKVRDVETLEYGSQTLDLWGVSQLVSRTQTRAVGLALALLAGGIGNQDTPIPALLDLMEARLARDGLDALDARQTGDLAAFRRHELAAALNRLRSLRVRRS